MFFRFSTLFSPTSSSSFFCWQVPGEIRKSRSERESEYFKELHRIRKMMLQSLISNKRLAKKMSFHEATSNNLDLSAELLRDSKMSGDEASADAQSLFSRENSDRESSVSGAYSTSQEELGERKWSESDGGSPGSPGSPRPRSSTTNSLLSRSISTDMKKQLKQVIYGILEQTSYSQDELLKKGGKKRRTNVMKATVKPSLDEEETLADKALRGLYDEIPGLEGIMRHFHQQKEEETDQETVSFLVFLQKSKFRHSCPLCHSHTHTSFLFLLFSSFLSCQLADFDDEVTAEEDYVNQMLAPSMSFQEEMKHHGGDFDGDGHISQHEVDMYRQVQLLSMTNDKVDMLDQHLTNHMFGEYEIMTRYVWFFFVFSFRY